MFMAVESDWVDCQCGERILLVDYNNHLDLHEAEIAAFDDMDSKHSDHEHNKDGARVLLSSDPQMISSNDNIRLSAGQPTETASKHSKPSRLGVRVSSAVAQYRH